MWVKTATFGEHSRKQSYKKEAHKKEPVFLTLEGIKLSHSQNPSKQDREEKETNETDFVIPIRKSKR